MTHSTLTLFPGQVAALAEAVAALAEAVAVLSEVPDTCQQLRAVFRPQLLARVVHRCVETTKPPGSPSASHTRR